MSSATAKGFTIGVTTVRIFSMLKESFDEFYEHIAACFDLVTFASKASASLANIVHKTTPCASLQHARIT